MKTRFYKCNKCLNIVTKINDSGSNLSCCGEEMVELIPNSTDASLEKHIPVYEIVDNKVHVHIGEIPHPMTLEHHIEWVYLETKRGGQLKYIFDKPEAKVSFTICDCDEVEHIYEHCNLHGLWMK